MATYFSDMLTGDILQADFGPTPDGNISHSMVVTSKDASNNIYLTYHTNNTKNRSINDLLAGNPGTRWYGLALYCDVMRGAAPGRSPPARPGGGDRMAITRNPRVWGAAVAAVLAIGLGWLGLRRLGNDTGLEDFRDNRPTATAAEVGGDDPDRVAAALVERWLRRFTTGEYGGASRLREYRIDQMAVLPASGGRFVVSVCVSVKPTGRSFGSWLGGSGGRVEDGWIHGKFLRFAVVRTGTGYQLRELGPGPL